MVSVGLGDDTTMPEIIPLIQGSTPSGCSDLVAGLIPTQKPESSPDGASGP
jgi:hypothetical protein